jgi:hypothetical protein
MLQRIILSPEDIDGISDLFSFPCVGDVWYHKGRQYRIAKIRLLANGGYDLVME